MSISVKTNFTNPRKQPTNAGVPAEVRVQYQSVDEKTNQAFNFSVVTISDRCTDCNRLLPGPSRKQKLEGSQQ